MLAVHLVWAVVALVALVLGVIELRRSQLSESAERGLRERLEAAESKASDAVRIAGDAAGFTRGVVAEMEGVRSQLRSGLKVAHTELDELKSKVQSLEVQKIQRRVGL